MLAMRFRVVTNLCNRLALSESCCSKEADRLERIKEELVGLTNDEVALAEQILGGFGDEEHGTARLDLPFEGQTDTSRITNLALRCFLMVRQLQQVLGWHLFQDPDRFQTPAKGCTDLADETMPNGVPLEQHMDPLVMQALRALQEAVEDEDIDDLISAIATAKALGIGNEEISFSEAILHLRLQRRRQDATEALDRALADPFASLVRLRTAVIAGRIATICPEYLNHAEKILADREHEARKLLPSILTSQSRNATGVSCRKRVRFADEIKLHEALLEEVRIYRIC